VSAFEDTPHTSPCFSSCSSDEDLHNVSFANKAWYKFSKLSIVAASMLGALGEAIKWSHQVSEQIYEFVRYVYLQGTISDHLL